jgi:hypothetical protein
VQQQFQKQDDSKSKSVSVANENKFEFNIDWEQLPNRTKTGKQDPRNKQTERTVPRPEFFISKFKKLRFRARHQWNIFNQRAGAKWDFWVIRTGELAARWQQAKLAEKQAYFWPQQQKLSLLRGASIQQLS